ncbi:MAG: hypothetical protein GY716_14530 [bacterium]|nr:hypothetical protein [bacterium]
MIGRTETRVAACVALTLLVTTACKSGDTLGSGIVPAVADFTPEASSVDERYVSMQTRSIDGGRIVLDVLLTDVDEPVGGVAFSIGYPNNFSQFVEVTDSEIFDSGNCFFSESAPRSGEVFIGCTVIGPTAAAVEGTQIAASLQFLVFGAAEADSPNIDFLGQNLGGGGSAVLDGSNQPQPILVDWFTGTLQGFPTDP